MRAAAVYSNKCDRRDCYIVRTLDLDKLDFDFP